MFDLTIKKILIENGVVQLFYESTTLIHAWIENVDKHRPDILDFQIDYLNQVAKTKLEDIYQLARGISISLKFSFSDNQKKLSYTLKQSPQKIVFNRDVPNLLFFINSKKELIIHLSLKKQFEFESTFKFAGIELDSFLKQQKKEKIARQKVNEIINTMIVGTCFTRNIFTSDDYFNPDYKKYFHIAHTAFHNSFLSLMSSPIEETPYQKILDLKEKNVLKFIEIEFKKNFFDIVDEQKPDCIIVDNYIDATRPVIEYKSNCYLTYNKYFSESIFKRFFSMCDIIYPGTQLQETLYRLSIREFAAQIKKRNLLNVILIGGRLSNRKINTKSGIVEEWTEKSDWIEFTNNNWNRMDQIFLEELPFATYIDMRKTKWLSDVHSPIVGGASPSHYQSEFYKECFAQIKDSVFEEKNEKL